MDTSRLEIIRQCNPAQNPDKTRYTWDERGMGLLFAEAYRDALLCAEQIKAFSRKQPKTRVETAKPSFRHAKND